ncbi:MAG TPA: aspartate/glutamate racemase family protein [Roseiflexaceae bacterium]|nr:aspartate/glutamate racemase family protein [Roseiflexaceae bacterium]
MLTFLHTSAAHIATFERLLAEQGPGIPARHLVDATLLDEARTTGITAELERRVADLIGGALAEGATVVLCTCSTVGGCAEALGERDGLPVLRVDRAMAEAAVARGQRILIAATVASTLAPTGDLLRDAAERAGAQPQIDTLLCEAAWPLFERGELDAYHRTIAESIRAVADRYDVVVLAQASMTGAAALCADLPTPILSSPRLGLAAAIHRYQQRSTMIFLHGGGDHSDSRADTFGRFVQAALSHSDGPLVLAAAANTTDEAQKLAEEYVPIFRALDVPETRLRTLALTPDAPLERSALEQIGPCGLFVCGGETPIYHRALCRQPDWRRLLAERGIPYGGTSSGAAVAAGRAIIGGWQAERGGRSRAMLYQGAGEGLGPLTVEPGLALVPFSVDVHASQWGTLLRLIHAVDLGLVEDGWAIDEDTLLVVGPEGPRLYGRGHAYHVARGPAGAAVTVHTAE